MKVWLLIFILAVSSSVYLGDPLRKQLVLKEELPLPPNAAFINKWGVGLAAPAAMGYWLKFLSTVGGWMVSERVNTLPAVTQIFSRPERVAWMKTYLNGIVELAPNFAEPYMYAGIMFYWYGRDEAAATEFLEKALAAGIDKWEIPFYIGVQASRSNKFEKASKFLLQAALYKDAPAVVPLMATTIAAKTGKPEAGVALLDALLLNLPPKMETFRGLLEADRQVQFAMYNLNLAIEKYQTEKGKLPIEFQQLIDAGYIVEDDLIINQEGTLRISGDKVVLDIH